MGTDQLLELADRVAIAVQSIATDADPVEAVATLRGIEELIEISIDAVQAEHRSEIERIRDGFVTAPGRLRVVKGSRGGRAYL